MVGMWVGWWNNMGGTVTYGRVAHTCTISISSFIISTMSAMDVLCAVRRPSVRFIVAVSPSPPPLPSLPPLLPLVRTGLTLRRARGPRPRDSVELRRPETKLSSNKLSSARSEGGRTGDTGLCIDFFGDRDAAPCAAPLPPLLPPPPLLLLLLLLAARALSSGAGEVL